MKKKIIITIGIGLFLLIVMIANPVIGFMVPDDRIGGMGSVWCKLKENGVIKEKIEETEEFLFEKLIGTGEKFQIGKMYEENLSVVNVRNRVFL